MGSHESASRHGGGGGGAVTRRGDCGAALAQSLRASGSQSVSAIVEV